jgi:hypothetical protein
MRRWTLRHRTNRRMAPRPKKVAAKAKTHTERVEVPGVRPAAFKLVEWAPDSFHLFRSSRKIGTAAAEGGWSARFRFGKKEWKGSAESADALLRLVGTFMLASEARDAAARPLEEDRKGGGRKNKDERLSLEFLKRAQTVRVAEFEALIDTCRKRITPA